MQNSLFRKVLSVLLFLPIVTLNPGYAYKEFILNSDKMA